MLKIYIDVCCLNRPFDNQSLPRIHLESEAVQLILLYCEAGYLEWIGSEIIEYEVNQTPDFGRRELLKLLTLQSKRYIKINENIRERAREIQSWKVSGFDALHIACAEYGKADVFLTTDDGILKKAKKYKRKLKVRIFNPLTWVQEAKII